VDNNLIGGEVQCSTTLYAFEDNFGMGLLASVVVIVVVVAPPNVANFNCSIIVPIVSMGHKKNYKYKE